MINIIENWAEISGQIESISSDSSAALSDLTLRIEKILPVKGFPNLVKAKADDRIIIKIKKPELERLNLKSGDKISGLVRAASLNNYHFKLGSIRRVRAS